MNSESSANDIAHQVGLSREEVNSRYSQWAQSNKYESDLREDLYRGPSIAAETLAELFSEGAERPRSNVKVLDVAAGTGFVADKLKQHGFAQIDALEPSDGMISVAKKKRLYTHIFQECLNTEPTKIDSGTLAKDYYDAVVCSGGMGEGHIPCTGLDEMIRVVKPGGYVVIVMREAYLQTVGEYRNRLEPRMDRLARSGQWHIVSRNVVPRYSFDNNGVVFVFRVK